MSFFCVISKLWGFTLRESKIPSEYNFPVLLWKWNSENGDWREQIQDYVTNCHVLFPELCFIGWPSGLLAEWFQKFSDCFSGYAIQVMLTF